MTRNAPAPRVYSYIRFSHIKQAAGASTERQSEYAQKWAKDHGLVLDDELSMRDEGLSAFHQHHITKGALGVFLRAIEDERIPPGSVLIVEGLDRLSRAEPMLAQTQLSSIVMAGITLVTASDGKVYSRESLKSSPMDLVYSLLVMIRAHEESDTKSRRVTDAIRRQCKGWVDGTFRGMVKIGKTPAWLQVVDGKWQLIEPRAEAIRYAVDQFLRGMGVGRITQELHERGMAPSGKTPESGHITKLLSHPSIVGEKHVDLGDGETYILTGYYPPLISQETWATLQDRTEARGRKHIKGDIPSVLTGHGVTFCGYCGAPMKAQMMVSRRRPDGTIPAADRRLQCSRTNVGGGCIVKGSCSSAHIERALMNYCSDMMNLRALYQSDESAAPRAKLAAEKAKLVDIETKIERLTTVILAAEESDVPMIFLRKARELEDERGSITQRIHKLEKALSEAMRANLDGAEELWRSLASDVEAMKYEARIQARQLVFDTFKKIVVYGKGVNPGTIERGASEVLLISRSGVGRTLRVDRHGRWEAGENYTLGGVDGGPLLPAAVPEPVRSRIRARL